MLCEAKLAIAHSGSQPKRANKKKEMPRKSRSKSSTIVENDSVALKYNVVSPLQPVKSKNVTKIALKIDDTIKIAIVNEITPVSTRQPIKLSEESESIRENLFPDESVGVKSSAIIVNSKVKKAYKIVGKCTGALGGNGYDGAIYGELTMHSMQKVTDYLVEHCGMDHKSRFIDVGSGLGKPNFHVAQYPEVRLSLGIELEEIRWQLAMYNLHKLLPHVSEVSKPVKMTVESKKVTVIPLSEEPIVHCLKKGKNGKKQPLEQNGKENIASPASNASAPLNGNTLFICKDIDEATTMDPFTHVYMFDLGFPPPLQQSIARKFNTSVHCQYLVSYRPPHRVISEYLYDVEFVHQLSTSMHGSGEGHTAYFYKRLSTPAVPKTSDLKLTVPGRLHLAEEDEEIVCDRAFAAAVELAVGELSALKQHADSAVLAHLDAGRPTRTRRPPRREICT